MGLLQAVKDADTGETGLAFVDEHNEVVAEFDQGDLGSNGPTAELEILRGDLAHLLYTHGREAITYRFDDRITVVTETAAGVQVTFAHGEPQTFDLVLVAEGIGSSTRQLVFGPEVTRCPLNLYTGYFTIPRGETDTSVARWFNAPGGRTVLVRPDRHGTTRALLTLQQEPAGYEDLSPAQQKALLQERFADAG